MCFLRQPSKQPSRAFLQGWRFYLQKPGPQMVDRFNEGYGFEDFAKAVMMINTRGLYAIKQNK